MPYPTFFAGQRLTAGLLREMQPTFVYKPADESRANTTTLTPDSHLVVPMKARVWYEVSGVIFYSAATGSDLSLGPDPLFDSGLQVYYPPVSATATSGSVSYIREDAVFFLGGIGTSSVVAVSYRGLVHSATDYQFTWRWAQVVAGATATTVHAGSYIRLEPAWYG